MNCDYISRLCVKNKMLGRNCEITYSNDKFQLCYPKGCNSFIVIGNDGISFDSNEIGKYVDSWSELVEYYDNIGLFEFREKIIAFVLMSLVDPIRTPARLLNDIRKDYRFHNLTNESSMFVVKKRKFVPTLDSISE